MSKKQRSLISLLLVFFISFNLSVSVVAENVSKITKEEIRSAAQKTIDYYNKTYKVKGYQGILDWPALGLFAFGEDVSGPKWTVNGKNGPYWREEEVKKGVGLSKVKNTDFQRTIIGITSAGKNPRNFGGINLVEVVKGTMLPNGHFADSAADNKTGKPVGEDLVNAHIFGIIAMHIAGEPIPNRDKAVEWLENAQNRDGGFTWDVKYFDDPDDYLFVRSDVDMTAGALMAFAILGEDESNPAVKKALEFLKDQQLDNGGFHSWGAENPESCAWAIQAIRLMGQDPMGPEWTNKNGLNPVTALLRFQRTDGSFVHVLSEDDMLSVYENSMSTEQALYGLADAYNSKAAYDMLHEKYRKEAEKYLFKDFKPGDYAFKETMDLVYDYVISGNEDGTFKPKNNVNRAELSKMLVNVLGLRREAKEFDKLSKFKDVNNDHWAYGSVGICTGKGYMSGIKEGIFEPNVSVTGEQLMTILVRALKLDKEGKNEIDGYMVIAKEKGLIYKDFNPKEPVNRSQCAWSLYQFKNIIDKK